MHEDKQTTTLLLPFLFSERTNLLIKYYLYINILTTKLLVVANIPPATTQNECFKCKLVWPSHRSQARTGLLLKTPTIFHFWWMFILMDGWLGLLLFPVIRTGQGRAGQRTLFLKLNSFSLLRLVNWCPHEIRESERLCVWTSLFSY